MVRGEWRKYLNSIIDPGEQIENDQTAFDISVVNFEENGKRNPIPYVLPPGIQRERILGSTALQQQNEQSLAMRVCNLENGDARGTFKNVNMDMRTYNKIKFFVHAEELNPEDFNLQDNDLTVFIRIGSDYNYNYYEYEVPLKISQWGASRTRDIWPEENEIEIDFDNLRLAKNTRNNEIRNGNQNISFNDPYTYQISNSTDKITIMSNPNIGNVRTIMLGVKNPINEIDDDGMSKCAEIWINELRLTDFDERGGYAAKGQIKTKLADLGSISLAGNLSTVGFGSLEQSVTERSKEEMRQYNLTSNLELGKFFSQNSNIKIPLFIGIA